MKSINWEVRIKNKNFWLTLVIVDSGVGCPVWLSMGFWCIE